MPSSYRSEPVHEDFDRMRAGVAYVYVAGAGNLADHVRVWLRHPSGRQRVVDFAVRLEDGRVWSDQTCYGDVDRPPAEVLTSADSSSTATRAKALVRAHVRDGGFREDVERAVWRGRYRALSIGELEPTADCPDGVGHCRHGGFEAHIAGRIFAVDAGLTRVLDHVCDHKSHTDTICDWGCDRPYTWLDTNGLGIEAFERAATRDEVTARLLEAARQR